MIVYIILVVILCILLRPMYQEPRILRNVFTHKVCDAIVELAKPGMKPSTVSKDGSLDLKVRKSETNWLKPFDSELVKRVMDKCVSMTDRPFANAEYLQVLKYTPGGFYKPHQDAFNFSVEKNPRLYTCIIALNDGYEGGETSFPNIGKDYKLNKGDVLLFNTLNDWGRLTVKALHGGKPVISGDKWICNLWIHRYPYDTEAKE